MATVYSGTVTYNQYYSGSGINWTISDAGLLSITKRNTGDTYDGYMYSDSTSLAHRLSLTSQMISAVKTISFASNVTMSALTNNELLKFGVFANLESVTSLPQTITYTTSVSGFTLGSMFDGCLKLKSVTFPSSWANYNVTSFNRMFYGCKNLTTVNGLYNATAHVKTMDYTWYGCTSLSTLNISSWDTNSVTSAQHMFDGCSSLTSITLKSGSLSFPSNKDFSYMFANCKALTTINNLAYIRLTMATNTNYMFYNCTALTSSIDFTVSASDHNTSQITTARGMFYNCEKVPTISFSSKATFDACANMADMFCNCKSLTAINGFSYVKAPYCTTTSQMFWNCELLTSISFNQEFGSSYLTNTYGMFYGCKALASLDLSHFDTTNVTNMSYMFFKCESLESLDLSGFDTSNVTNMGNMFSGCKSLASADVSNFNTRKVTSMDHMFYNCEVLTSLDMSTFAPIVCTTFDSMFYGCKEITTTGIGSGFDTSSATTMRNMFYECQKLQLLDLSGFDTSNVTDMHSMFYNCKVLTGIDVSGFDTSNVTDMSNMFYNAHNLTTLNVSGFNTSKVTSMASMFCATSISGLTLSSFSTLNVTSMNAMFKNCKDLMSLDLDTFNTSNVTDMKEMFLNTLRLTTVELGEHFSTDALATADAKKLGFAPATNTTTQTAVIGDMDFINLSTADKEGVWSRNVVNAFDATAYRSTNGHEESTGQDVTFTVRWVTSALTADRTITIYKKHTYEPLYPSAPDMTVEVEGNAGTQDITLADVGSDAYDFRLEFYDGTNTFTSFPSVSSTEQVIIITPDGDLQLLLDTSASSGDDYDIYQALISLGWDQDVVV